MLRVCALGDLRLVERAPASMLSSAPARSSAGAGNSLRTGGSFERFAGHRLAGYREEPYMPPTQLQTSALGFPRMGAARELKFALEAFWRGERTEDELQATARELRARHWQLQQAAGITHIPSNDFSLYDQVLDTLVAVGATPERFGAGPMSLAGYFAMARNSREQTAMEMTKWFDTNYHYLVPEWSATLAFQAAPEKAVSEFLEAKALGVDTRPVLIGPCTLLLLGKPVAPGFDQWSLLPKLLGAYRDVLTALKNAGATSVQIDEPCLALDLPEAVTGLYPSTFAQLASANLPIHLTTYFAALEENLPLAFALPVASVHLDLVRAPEQLAAALPLVTPEQSLSLGLVDGRNIWVNDFESSRALIDQAVASLGATRVVLAPSCSLLHVPVDAEGETKLAPEVRSWMAFAVQKLDELRALAEGADRAPAKHALNRAALASRAAAESSRDEHVRSAMHSLVPEDYRRAAHYEQRAKAQETSLGLPLLPTTTIGSFPQTAEVRKARAAWRSGTLAQADYDTFLEEETMRCLREQEEAGLDLLVHGEFERNDMVEYFGEQLQGFAFTRNGWVQSYGSRCVKPPVIYGDVARPAPMTVRWSSFAQSQTQKPVKGMLTGPVTVLQWSFVRDDIARSEVALQIAMALREEVRDLEAAGIRAIQLDEPALREGLPLRRSGWDAYLKWAVDAFRLATSGVAESTQIHTHMCYCEFESILASIAALDADVISMESARSKGELLHAFSQAAYPNGIGPGVWDIHSPRVPPQSEMEELLRNAAAVIRPEQLWVNPDCGLKTRDWPEVRTALRNMTAAAKSARLALVPEPVS
jgi:5-methyltetrahydropteroyltriglutamate--homocysteine methyltransferase